MNKQDIINTLKLLKEFSKKRNFTQSIDLIVNLNGLNVKKPEDQVDLFLTLPHPFNKKLRICAFADKSLKDIAKVFDKVISEDEFLIYKDKKKIKQLSKEYDSFIAQANLMGKVATVFGKVLGPKHKMPNPKAGCVFPPTADLNILKDKLLNTLQLKTKNELIVRACVGKEDMKEEELAENIFYVYNSLMHALPNEEHNIKNVYLKYTMGIPIEVGEKRENIEKNILRRVSAKEKKLLEKVLSKEQSSEKKVYEKNHLEKRSRKTEEEKKEVSQKRSKKEKLEKIVKVEEKK